MHEVVVNFAFFEAYFSYSIVRSRRGLVGSVLAY